MISRKCDGIFLAAGQDATDAAWLFHARREATPPCSQKNPSRRVASQWGVCHVVGLAKGNALVFALRLASIPIGWQRILRIIMK